MERKNENEKISNFTSSILTIFLKRMRKLVASERLNKRIIISNPSPHTYPSKSPILPPLLDGRRRWRRILA